MLVFSVLLALCIAQMMSHQKCYYANVISFLEAKASKGMHQVCIEKSPDRHLSIHLH